MIELVNILGDFNTHDFEVAPEVAFSNRLETKFIVPEIELPRLLAALKKNYAVVMFDQNPFSDYSTLYYDTPGYGSYLAHHNQRAKRCKIRERTYLASNTSFLEVKTQLNAHRVNKERIRRTPASPLNWLKDELDFLKAKSPLDPNSLIPTVSSKYSRLTLLNNTLAERVTIDVNLSFSAHNSVKKLSNFAVVEIKQALKEQSPAIAGLKNLGIKPVAISKYCLGINYLYPAIKKNNFKHRLNAINNIMHHDASTHTIA